MNWWPRRVTLRQLGLAGAVVLGLAVLALVVYSWVELARFERVEARRTAFVYAAPQALAPGVHVRLADLAGTLIRLQYTETKDVPKAPGQFRRGAQGDVVQIWLADPAGNTVELATPTIWGIAESNRNG